MKARIHIVVGCLALIATLASAQVVPVGKSAHWKTKLILTSLPNATAPVLARATNCEGFTMQQPATVVPNGVAALEPELCYGAEFALIPASPDVATESRFVYTDGADRASFTSTALTAWRVSQRVAIDSTAEVAAYATIFCYERTPLTATVYRPDNPFLYAFDYFDCVPPEPSPQQRRPLGIVQHRVNADGLATVRFSIGYEALMSYHGLPDVHGFLTATQADGFGNGAVTPLVAAPPVTQ